MTATSTETEPAEAIKEMVPAVVVTAPAEELVEAAGRLAADVDAEAGTETTSLSGYCTSCANACATRCSF